MYWWGQANISDYQRKPIRRDLKGKGKLGGASATSKQPTIKKDPTVKRDVTIKKESTIKAEPTKTAKELSKEKSKAPVEKPTKAGTLDWSKAKSKAEKEKEKADELKARAETEAKEAKVKREKGKEEKEKEKLKVKPVEVAKVVASAHSPLHGGLTQFIERSETKNRSSRSIRL